MISSRTGPTHFAIILEAQLFEQSRSAKACLCQATRSAASLPTAPGTSIGSKLQPSAHGKLTLDQGNGHAGSSAALALALPGLDSDLAVVFAVPLPLVPLPLLALFFSVFGFWLLVLKDSEVLAPSFFLFFFSSRASETAAAFAQDLLFQVDLERLGLVRLHRRVRGWGRCRWGRCWGGSSTRRCSGLGIHQGLLLSRSGCCTSLAEDLQAWQLLVCLQLPLHHVLTQLHHP